MEYLPQLPVVHAYIKMKYWPVTDTTDAGVPEYSNDDALLVMLPVPRDQGCDARHDKGCWHSVQEEARVETE